MKKTSLISWALFGLLAACHADESNVIAVRGEVRAQLSGDGMPADQPEKTFQHDEMWLDLDPDGALWGFFAHPWDLPRRQHAYDLEVVFAPRDVPGSTDLLDARVCFVSCGDHPERDGCAGPCFSSLQGGSADILSISEDGRSFDIDFEFDVADAEGRVIHVRSGKARTSD